ncbi:HTH-type transcriptional regulator YesS [Thalassocella blandensis]|nr:HTH-type transcriptional regulator YesS [Thalassocella blandensis]
MPTLTQDHTIQLLTQLAPREGYNLTALSDVRILRSNRPLSNTPVLYDPGLVFVCQGSKRGYFGNELYLYDEHHYLAVSTPVPFTMESQATKKTPLFALYLHLDFKLAADIILELDNEDSPPIASRPSSMMSSEMDKRMKASIFQLVETLCHPIESKLLGPCKLREIYFRVLTGPQGNTVREALSMKGSFGTIYKILRFIHKHFNQSINVDQLAHLAGMSTPAFHNNFKAVTQTTPIQYLKTIRLHRARLLMVRQNLTALSASYEVGYESPSQFNREFKRLFGRPPAEEARHMKRLYLIPPLREENVYISSH